MLEKFTLPTGQGVFENFGEMQARTINDADYQILRQVAENRFIKAKFSDHPAKGTIRSYREVKDLLPKLDGQKFEDWVEEELEKRRIEANETGFFRKLKIVDVGFGDGGFLLGCREKWDFNEVELIGYGDTRYYPTKENIEKLKDNKIELIDGNICNIKKELWENSVDVVVSSMALMHIEYPVFELIKDIYYVLKTNGRAYIYAGDLIIYEENLYNESLPSEDINLVSNLNYRSQERIEEYVKSKNIPFLLKYGQISFQKNNIDINKIGIETLQLWPNLEWFGVSVVRINNINN